LRDLRSVEVAVTRVAGVSRPGFKATWLMSLQSRNQDGHKERKDLIERALWVLCVLLRQQSAQL